LYDGQYRRIQKHHSHDDFNKNLNNSKMMRKKKTKLKNSVGIDLKIIKDEIVLGKKDSIISSNKIDNNMIIDEIKIDELKRSGFKKTLRE